MAERLLPDAKKTLMSHVIKLSDGSMAGVASFVDFPFVTATGTECRILGLVSIILISNFNILATWRHVFIGLTSKQPETGANSQFFLNDQEQPH